MLIVRESGPFEDRGVRDLPQMLRAGDVLVFNDTRVIPAQLEGRRGEAKIGATLHKRIDLRRWQAFVRNAKRLRPGDVAEFGGGVTAVAEEKQNRMIAGPLIVIDTETSFRGIPSKSRSMSWSDEIATPHTPTSPRERG